MDKFTIPPGYPGKCTPDKLKKMADKLKKMADKLKKMADKLKDSPGFRGRFANAGTRRDQRNVISNHLGADSGATRPPDREQLRRFFCQYYGIANPPANLDPCAEDRTLLFMLDPPRWKDDGEDPTVVTKPPSFKELIEAKLGPCEPDPMQELRDMVLSEITTAFGDSHVRKQAKSRSLAAAYGASMTSAAADTISKPITFADIERFSTYMDEVAPIPRRDWFLLDTPLMRGEFGRLDGVRFINASPSYQSLPKKETPVNTKPLTITTRTFTYVNGVDVNNFTSAELYDLIAREEAQIRKLSEIHHKPVMLQQEIERRQAGIAALVAHLDAVTVVATPAPAPITDSTQ